MKTPKLLLIIAGSLAVIAAVLIAVSCIPRAEIGRASCRERV